MRLNTFGEVIGAAGKAGIVPQSVFSQRMEKSCVPSLIDVRTKCTAELTDIFMAASFEIFDGKVDSLLIINTNISRVRICLYLIIQ